MRLMAHVHRESVQSIWIRAAPIVNAVNAAMTLAASHTCHVSKIFSVTWTNHCLLPQQSRVVLLIDLVPTFVRDTFPLECV